MAGKSLADSVPDEFWSVIEDSRQDPTRLRERLKTMSRREIIHFCWTYEELAGHLRTERHSAYVQRDLSEDGVAELANWVVAEGKEYYQKIMDHPELIPVRKNDPGLLSESVKEYEERFHDDLPPNTEEWDEEWKEHGKESPWD